MNLPEFWQAEIDRHEWHIADANAAHGGAWEDLLLLVAIITVVFATACGVPEHDCVTRGGMYVDHAACTSELETMQARIEYEAEQLGYRPHVLEGALLFVLTTGLDDQGRWRNDQGLMIRGQTDCSMGMVEVAQWNGEAWSRTALAHEAFHLAQECVRDESVRADCMAHPDAPRYEGIDLATWCDIDAQHPHWEDTVNPAIRAINAGGPL